MPSTWTSTTDWKNKIVLLIRIAIIQVSFLLLFLLPGGLLLRLPGGLLLRLPGRFRFLCSEGWLVSGV
jgi:hypothetical protein